MNSQKPANQNSHGLARRSLLRDPKSTQTALSRRNFIQTGTAAGGGLLLAFWLNSDETFSASNGNESAAISPPGQLTSSGDPFVFTPNAWIKVDTSNRVTFILDRVEMGQGTMTSHAMLVAEEIGIDPKDLLIEFAGANRVYDNPALGLQITGGSSSVATSWESLRLAAATAREMLKKAAAKTWSVPEGQCEKIPGSAGFVHRASGRQLLFGQLAPLAATLRAPKVKLKEAKDFSIIGRSIERVDGLIKVNGTAGFGIDASLPNQKIPVAVVVRPPVPFGTVSSVEDHEVKLAPGVIAVTTVTSGVAIVGKTYWQARQASKHLKVTWNEGRLANFSSDKLEKNWEARVRTESGSSARKSGDIKKGRENSSKNIEAIYSVPYQAHATMEPQNCLAWVKENSCEIWAPTQSPGAAQDLAARILGWKHDQIKVNQTLIGGGFGRRIPQDFVAEAVEISRAIKGPVKVIWSREDDFQNDFFRTATVNFCQGSIDRDGNITSWFHRLISPSILAHLSDTLFSPALPNFLPNNVKGMLARTAEKIFDGMVTDPTSVEGAATFAYGINNARVEWIQDEPGVPIGFWRSVGHSQNAFVVESFIDELAHLAGKDPYEFRRSLLKDAKRNLQVLELAAQKANWHLPPAEGIYRGIAQNESFKTFCAQVIEIKKIGNELRMHRVVCAVDCGVIINPDLVRAQVESSIVYGLSSAFKGRITFENGRVQQSNFHDFEVLRSPEMPTIEVHIVDSGEPPTGIGEPGLPPVAPALANAIFMATGIRQRSMPLNLKLS